MFLTLTFDDQRVPDMSWTRDLVPKVYVDFMKRFRSLISPCSVRFFHCGEYGSNYERPHHHALIFGHRFTDLEAVTMVRGNYIYRSATLERLWSYGYCSIGEVTFESAAYCARYALKKATPEELGDRHPPYVTMSRRPGIGAGYFDRWKDDIYRRDKIVIRDGVVCRPPRFYDDLATKFYGDDFLQEIKNERRLYNEKQGREDYKKRLEAFYRSRNKSFARYLDDHGRDFGLSLLRDLPPIDSEQLLREEKVTLQRAELLERALHAGEKR